MKLFKLLTSLFFIFLSTTIVFSQRGKNGDYNASTQGNIVNTYATVNSIVSPTAIDVDDNSMIGGVIFGSALEEGDLIMIIQMGGAEVDINPRTVDQDGKLYTTTNSQTWSGAFWLDWDLFGRVTNLNNAGKFEKVEVLSVSGSNRINLSCALKNNYDPAGHVQIVRMPRFNNLTVSGGLESIVPIDWNGNVGGIVAIEVDGIIDLNGGSSISAEGKGFRGGQVDPNGKTGNSAAEDEARFPGTYDSSEGSEKGESIFGHYAELDAISSRYGLGAAANGGGGGGYQNCGGGGGANVGWGPGTGRGNPQGYSAIWDLELAGYGGSTTEGGGRGGYALSQNNADPTSVGPANFAWGGDNRKVNGGLGGHAIPYDATRLYFGGGGGAGDQDSDQGGSGGRGGGIVYLVNYGSFTGSGLIVVNGQDGQNSNPNNESFAQAGSSITGNDGAGGGGAGGSIYIENATALDYDIKLKADGGKGGDQNLQFATGGTPREASGPGGGGSGGYIAYAVGGPNQTLNSGMNGVTNSPHMVAFPPNGATAGRIGMGSMPADFYDLIVRDTVICENSTVELTVSVAGTLPAGSTVEWYTQGFGGASINSGLTYTTPSLATNTTYYVGVCPGSFRLPINVGLTPLDDASFTSTDFCVSTTNTISGVATPSGIFAIASQTGSATIDPNSGILSGFAAGDQITIEYTTPAGGCQNSSTQVVNVTPLDDASFTSTDFCVSTTNTISGVATPSGTFAIASQTGSATIDPSSGILSGFAAGDQITIEYTTPAGACQNSSTQVVNVTPLDDASFTSTDFCASTTNTISGVATPSGTFAIASQTGSATIDPSSGILSGFAAGDQITIEYTTPAGACQNSSTQVVNVTPLDDASFTSTDFCASTTNTISGVATPSGTFAIASQTGSATIDPSSGILSGFAAGDQITIEYTTPASGCQNSSTQVVNVTPLDDASFTSTDFCASTTNTISGVATPSGTFAIASQTGSATIDPSSGILSGFVAGDQITIEYTTPAGACQNSSTQVVNVTPLDDASFTSTDFCASTTNTISGVATPSGTFAIASQTGSATIDPSSGILSGFAAGDQITIEYTTPAGGCVNTSTQVVNVTPLDDASFTSTDFCASTTNTISGVVTPSGTFAIASQTGSATIDPSSGILSGFAAGDQITIEYTTPASGCQNSSTQVVNVTPLDDASFTSTDFCASTTNTISGVATPSGTFAIASQTGSATIDPSSGILSGFVAGDQITIEYTTPAGACQNSSTQVVNVTPLDDASFTSTDFCASTTNTISGVATPSGTFAIASQTGSATIDPSSGILSGFAAGDQITIEYTTPAGGCVNTSTQVVNVTPLDDASFTSTDFCASTTNTISGVATPSGTFAIASQTGSATIDPSSGILSGFAAGDQITIEYTTPAGGCVNTSTQVVNVTPLDDASFTSTDFCASTTNTISGVATPSGTFAIASQTGSATIDPSSGVLSGFAAGDQITIEYTTPAGACQNSSTQVVNVTPLDDASFTSTDFCVSTTNTISGVATPSGTFAIASQTGSATIDPSSGILSGFVAGDQITIEYTTPAGGCVNTSTQVVNVAPLDDASFTSTDFCASTTNTISGVATPSGTFAIASQTGSATIDPSSGILSGFAAGDQITIEYTTPVGGCVNTSTQVVNVTPLDDASFTSTDFCASTTNTISGVATPSGTFAIASQTGSATIDPSSGILSGFAAGDQITIEYTTPAGACQNSSTQVVNVTPLDDASFTSTDFCASTTNTISGVATPSGTFAIASQTGSATIDPSSGVLSGFAAGDQITIEYTTPAGGCVNTSTQVVNVTPLDDASFTSTDFCASTTNTISGVATPSGTFAIASQTGSATIDPSSGILSGFAAGDQITIEYTTPAGGCVNTSTQVVNVTPLDDASFTSTDFCASTTNTISGVATPSGTFAIASQTGSATIDPSSGVLSGFVAGDQITIEYTTPAGACQNSSTQVVNVTPLDDASFTSTDFCVSTTNTISGVATPSGTFAIASQTGSATIDPSSGILSGFAAGDQITIEYTTPAGGCVNTSTQVVNVTPLDDASFTSTDFCASTTNTISGVATPSGTFAIASQTGSATIDPSSGILSGFAAGDQITIEYTTPVGGCQNSSTQVVNVTSLDDASFTSGDFCASTTNTISGVATPSGTFAIASQTGSATIDPSSGILSGFVAGDQITIEYTTPAGACQNSSTQVVNVIPLDDASFTSTDFCVSTTNTISGVATPSGTFAIASQTGSATIDPSSGILSGFAAGDQITIEYTTPAGGCVNTSTQVVNVTPLDDASFTSTDFCASTTNTISGVATPSGTFAIASQTGSATIDPSSGILSGFAAGDQITIEYTTPASGCQNSSTQVVNVTSLDDASFISGDFCASTTNTISGVATPSGTFAIASQTGSATIDPSSGVLSGFAAGDQITIEYTTPASGCQNSSTQVVNVIPLDDASFTSTDFCVSTTNTISGVATPSGTFAIASQTGSATIDPSSGILSGFAAGDQITIEYTTPAGGCVNTSTQVVNVTPLDDASFVMEPTCDGAVATIVGVSGGVFDFVSIPIDAAVIDPVTGLISGGEYNVMYDVVYSTNGACPTSSTETVVSSDCSVPDAVVIPTAITPDGDLINDEWEIPGLDEIDPNNVVRIYNRWGNLIFEHTSSESEPYSNNQWDGTYKGSKLPVASYYYIIDFSVDGIEPENGTVSIILNK